MFRARSTHSALSALTAGERGAGRGWVIETSCCSSISEIFGLCPGAGSHPTYPKPQETSTGCLGSPRHTLHGGFPDFLKQKITEGSSSNIETQPSTLFASAQERPGRRGHQTTQPSLQSLDLLVACIWRPNGPSLLAVLPLAYSPLCMCLELPRAQVPWKGRCEKLFNQP